MPVVPVVAVAPVVPAVPVVPVAAVVAVIPVVPRVAVVPVVPVVAVVPVVHVVAAVAVDLVAIYCALIKSVLEFAFPVWAALPDYFDYVKDGVQKRALCIILPGLSYCEALIASGLDTPFLAPER